LLFSTQYGLDDFFSTEQLSLDASPELLVAGSIFVLAAYARKAHWSGSSGPLTVGALERSIADGWFTGFSRAWGVVYIFAMGTLGSFLNGLVDIFFMPIFPFMAPPPGMFPAAVC